MAEFIKIGEVSTYSEKETEMFLKAIENTELSVCKEIYSCDDDVPGGNFILMLKDKDDPDEKPTIKKDDTEVKTKYTCDKDNIDILFDIINSYDHVGDILEIECYKSLKANDCFCNLFLFNAKYAYNTKKLVLNNKEEFKQLISGEIREHEFITDTFSGNQKLRVYIQ